MRLPMWNFYGALCIFCLTLPCVVHAHNLQMDTPMRWILRSKIHKATVTDANIGYIGSITIDGDLVEKSGLMSGEKVAVVSNTTGARLETYVIVGEKGSGEICMNGAAAHLIKTGEEIIIMGYELTEDGKVDVRTILVDEKNRFVRYLQNYGKE
jgi:aspartate 1-decarboxylase